MDKSELSGYQKLFRIRVFNISAEGSLLPTHSIEYTLPADLSLSLCEHSVTQCAQDGMCQLEVRLTVKCCLTTISHKNSRTGGGLCLLLLHRTSIIKPCQLQGYVVSSRMRKKCGDRKGCNVRNTGERNKRK
jgi:hypothetical protein